MGFKKRPKKYHVKFPLVLYAFDYHEFQDYQEVLSEAIGESVQYMELENIALPAGKYYAAVFYVEHNDYLDSFIDMLPPEFAHED